MKWGLIVQLNFALRSAHLARSHETTTPVQCKSQVAAEYQVGAILDYKLLTSANAQLLRK